MVSLSSPGCPAWTLCIGYPWSYIPPALVFKVPGITDPCNRWFKVAFSKTDCPFWKVGGTEFWILYPLAKYPWHYSGCWSFQNQCSHHSSHHGMKDLDMGVLRSPLFLLLSNSPLSFDRLLMICFGVNFFVFWEAGASFWLPGSVVASLSLHLDMPVALLSSEASTCWATWWCLMSLLNVFLSHSFVVLHLWGNNFQGCIFNFTSYFLHFI